MPRKALSRRIKVGRMWLICPVLFGAPTPSAAYDLSAVVNVAGIEGTYAPSMIRFWLTTNLGPCAGGQGFGSQLDYKPSGATLEERIANAQTIMSMLIAARVGGRSVKVFVRSADCNVEYIYLL